MAKKKKTTLRKTSRSRSSRKQTRVDMSKLRKHLDPSLKSLWVDHMQLSMRAEAIPVLGLTFFTLHDGKKLTEACRVNMSMDHLRGVADVICRAIDYYPKKTRGAPKKRR